MRNTTSAPEETGESFFWLQLHIDLEAYPFCLKAHRKFILLKLVAMTTEDQNMEALQTENSQLKSRVEEMTPKVKMLERDRNWQLEVPDDSEDEEVQEGLPALE